MADTADTTSISRAGHSHSAGATADASPFRDHAKVPLTSVARSQWQALGECAIEPNGYYLPGWELAVNASATGRTGASALCAFSDALASRLIGLLPVVPMRRAYQIPLPALVSAHPYGTLCTPPLDRDMAREAAAQLMQHAARTGAHAIVLREISLDGPVMEAFAAELRQRGMRPRVLQSSVRACLDATRDGEELLHDALGAKKLKELRRQRHRLGERGAVCFEVARSPGEVTAAIETFMKIEASGWKGRLGTALIQDAGDASFIRCATVALAETGQCEIVMLRAGDIPVAAGIVLRHQDRAFYFKIGVDERFAKFSPGVQLTLDLTRHLCADGAITTADSTASPDHPMIDAIWRGRFAIADVLIPLRRHDPIVSLVHAALISRRVVLDLARRGIRVIRRSRNKR